MSAVQDGEARLTRIDTCLSVLTWITGADLAATVGIMLTLPHG
jgi:hypothetical protein